MEPNPGKKKTDGRPVAVMICLTLVVIAVLLIAAGYYYSAGKFPKQGLPAETTVFLPESETKSEEPVPPVLTGKQSYKLLTSDTPRFTEAWIDPLDAPAGTNQIVAARVENPSPVKEVSVTVITDDKEEAVSLRLSEGSKYNGIWSASHAISGTYEKKYRFRFTASDESGETSSVTITSR